MFWFGFMAYQPLLVTLSQILFIRIYQIFSSCPSDLMMTWWVAKLTCAWKFYSEKTGAQAQSHTLGLGSLDPVARRTVTILPGYSGWPGLLWVPRPALGARTTLAATDFTTVGSSGELFGLFRRESGFPCSRDDTAQFKLTEGLRPIGYPHLV